LFHIFLSQAGIGAIRAGLGAFEAGLDAFGQHIQVLDLHSPGMGSEHL